MKSGNFDRVCTDTGMGQESVIMGGPIPHSLRRYPTNAARSRLAELLGLPYEPSMQDWEWEIADTCRFQEFIDVYRNLHLPEQERVSLMEILIQCVEDLLQDPFRTGESRGVEEWKDVATLLRLHPRLHARSIYYWCCFDLSPYEESCFLISPLMRQVWLDVQDSLINTEE